MIKKRCFGDGPGKEFYAEYHDNQWGVPVHDDRLLFEMLILEGAQAGLSWETILKRRAGYKKAFHNFDIQKVAHITDKQLEALLSDTDIIRNKLKIHSARTNARVVLDIIKEFGSLDDYFWAYVKNKPLVNRMSSLKDLPTHTPISDAISKDLKKRGMSFVGTTIIYAFMQAVGITDDHLKWCFKAK